MIKIGHTHFDLLSEWVWVVLFNNFYNPFSFSKDEGKFLSYQNGRNSAKNAKRKGFPDVFFFSNS